MTSNGVGVSSECSDRELSLFSEKCAALSEMDEVTLYDVGWLQLLCIK